MEANGVIKMKDCVIANIFFERSGSSLQDFLVMNHNL